MRAFCLAGKVTEQKRGMRINFKLGFVTVIKAVFHS